MASTAWTAASALETRTTGTMPTPVMNARISLDVIAFTLSRDGVVGEKTNVPSVSRDQMRCGTSYLLKTAMPVNEQLERILKSPPLVSSPSLCRFLRYIVEETLAGRESEIKEHTLGVRVFDRG